jgi:hypothetical protein
VNKFRIKKIVMPTLSMFYGLIIEMYYAPKEHNPPHIHVRYQNNKADLDPEILYPNSVLI